MFRKGLIMSYKVLQDSKGRAPRFSITVGLREGYGPSAEVHDVGEVVVRVEKYLRDCSLVSRSFLTGLVTAGTVVYAWPGLKGGSANEPVAVYSGEVNPLYNSSMCREDIEKFLNGLAEVLGVYLKQTRVYVAFDGDMWILQEECSATPAGETA
jgi:hypothetical protein